MNETILQFGAGGFLRGFADLFAHHANTTGRPVGRIVVVQSTGEERARLINAAGGRYHVAIRGLERGAVVDRVEECASISRALVAQSQWDEVLAVAASPDLRFILSNVTEAGYAVSADDAPGATPPVSFPAKLRGALLARWRAGAAPPTMLPCELHEDNAAKLRALVVQVAERFGDPPAFVDWLREKCVWLASLVDRIVPGRPAEHPLLASDPLLIAAEPFAFWALESHPAAAAWPDHPAIVRTPDVRPYFLRKVRILNGAHTALLCRVGTDRFATVLDAMNDPPTAAWLERLVFEEIVPVLAGRCAEPEQFGRQTLERFRNPFLKHRLKDIALHHAAKKVIRLESTLKDYEERFGSRPPLLAAALAGDRVPPADF